MTELQNVFAEMKRLEPNRIAANKDRPPYRLVILADSTLSGFSCQLNESQSSKYPTPEAALSAALANLIYQMTPKPFGAPRKRPRLTPEMRGAIARQSKGK